MSLTISMVRACYADERVTSVTVTTRLYDGPNMFYSMWDDVVLKVKEDFGYDDQVNVPLKVMIIGIDSETDYYTQYLCYIAPGERIPYKFATFTVNDRHVRNYNVEKKFLGETCCIITSQYDIFSHTPAIKGEKCDRCKIFFEGARQVDGKFSCRACRENPWR